MNKSGLDMEDLFLLICGLAFTLGASRIKKRQQDRAFKKRFDREMSRYQLQEDNKKGGQE